MLDKLLAFLGTTNGIITLISLLVIIAILALSGVGISYSREHGWSVQPRKKHKKEKEFKNNNPESLLFDIRQSEKRLESDYEGIQRKYENLISVSKTSLITNVINLLLCDFPQIIEGKSDSVDRERDLLELYLDRDITEIFSRKLKELYESPDVKSSTTLSIEQYTEKIFNEIKIELKMKAQKYLLMETSSFIDELYKTCERNIIQFLNETIKAYITNLQNEKNEIDKALEDHKARLKYKIFACEQKEAEDAK